MNVKNDWSNFRQNKLFWTEDGQNYEKKRFFFVSTSFDFLALLRFDLRFEASGSTDSEIPSISVFILLEARFISRILSFARFISIICRSNNSSIFDKTSLDAEKMEVESGTIDFYQFVQIAEREPEKLTGAAKRKKRMTPRDSFRQRLVDLRERVKILKWIMFCETSLRSKNEL